MMPAAFDDPERNVASLTAPRLTVCRPLQERTPSLGPGCAGRVADRTPRRDRLEHGGIGAVRSASPVEKNLVVFCAVDLQHAHADGRRVRRIFGAEPAPGET